MKTIYPTELLPDSHYQRQNFPDNKSQDITRCYYKLKVFKRSGVC